MLLCHSRFLKIPQLRILCLVLYPIFKLGEEILENVKQRDYIDQHREVSPLRKADDALLLDNSNLSIEQQKEWLSEQFGKVVKE